MVNRDEFVRAVLELRPQLAACDCDGTLWDSDAGEGFFFWELTQGCFSQELAERMRKRYADYKAGRVPEDVMCGEMVSMHAGLPESRVRELASEYFNGGFVTNIFPEMRELVQELQRGGSDVWAVSSSNEWVIQAAMPHFGIRSDHVLAAAVEVEDGTVTDRLIRVPSGAGKAEAILEVVGRSPDAAFGNSQWDADMLKMAQHAFAVNPRPELEAEARRRGWPVYFPELIAQRAADVHVGRALP